MDGVAHPLGEVPLVQVVPRAIGVGEQVTRGLGEGQCVWNHGRSVGEDLGPVEAVVAYGDHHVPVARQLDRGERAGEPGPAASVVVDENRKGPVVGNGCVCAGPCPYVGRPCQVSVVAELGGGGEVGCASPTVPFCRIPDAGGHGSAVVRVPRERLRPGVVGPVDVGHADGVRPRRESEGLLRQRRFTGRDLLRALAPGRDDLFRDPAQRLLQGVEVPSALVGEDADDGRAALVEEDAHVVPGVGWPVPGLVGDLYSLEANHPREAGRVELAQEDVHHLFARLRVRQLGAQDLFQHATHLPGSGASEPDGGVPLDLEEPIRGPLVRWEAPLVYLPGRKGRQGRVRADPGLQEETIGRVLEPRLRVPPALEEPIHPVHAHCLDDHVGGGVVRRDDHLRHQVPQGRSDSGREGLEEPAAASHPVGSHRLALIEVEAPRRVVEEGLHHDRHLDDRQRVHRLVGPNGQLPARGHVLGVQRAHGVQAVEVRRHGLLQAGAIRLRVRAPRVRTG